MKVLFFIGDISLRGGTERSSMTVANLLADQGYEVYVFSIRGERKNLAFPLQDSICLNSLRMPSGTSLAIHVFSISRKLSRYIKTNGIEVIVSTEVMSCIFTMPLFLQNSIRKNVKYIVWEHFNFTVDLGLKTRKIMRKLAAKYADVVVTLTAKDKTMWEEKLSPEAKVVAIYNPAERLEQIKNYNKKSKNIIAVGRYTFQKGYDLLLETWRKVTTDMMAEESSWKLQIIGDGEDQILLNRIITENKLSGSVELIPNTSKVYEYFENAAFLAMSSRFEGLPMVLIEAQIFGLPVVAFDCFTGPSDIVIEGSGILCPPLDTEALKDAMIKLMRDEELRIRMSEKSRKLSSRFDGIEVGQKWNDLLQMLNEKTR